MSVEEFLPAAGQGAIGIEARQNDTRTREILARIDHANTSAALACERAFLAVLDGSCKTPIGGHATLAGGVLQFRGLIAKPDGSAAHETAVAGGRQDAMTIGADAGRALRQYAGPGFFD
jgi:hydroxymethylbilane synthase